MPSIPHQLVSSPARTRFGGDELLSPAARVVLAVLGFGVYACTFGLGLITVETPGQVPVVWPAAGVGLVMAYRWGRSAVALVTLAALVLGTYAFASLPLGLAMGLAYGGSAFLGADVLRRLGFEPALERLRDALALLLCGAIAAPLWSAFWMGAGLVWEGGHGLSSWSGLVARWWFADAVGVVAMAPILLVWHASTHINWRNSQGVEVCVWLGSLLVLEGLVFSNWQPSETLRYPLELAIFPVLLWSAVRFGQRGAALGVLATALMAYMPMVASLRDAPVEPFSLWMFIAIVSMTTIVLAAVVAEYRAREVEIKMNEERLRAFVRAIPDLAFVISQEGLYLDVFAPRASVFSERAQLLKGRNLCDIYPKKLTSQFMRVIGEVLNTGEVRVWRYMMDFKGKTHWFEGRVAPMETLEGHPRSVFWVAYDITENQQATAALRERDRLLQALTDAEAALLKSRDYHGGLARTLEIIGEGLNLDRIQVFLRREFAGTDVLRSEIVWKRPVGSVGGAGGIDVEGSGLVIEQAEFRGPWSTLSAGAAWALKSRADAPAKLTAHLPSNLNVSALWVPIFVEDRLGGAIEFSIHREIGEWNDNSRAVFLSLAGSLGGFIETKRIESELKEAKRLADAANNAKGDFLAMMSHEIRTPMNAILGFADLLEQSELDETQSEYSKIISRSGRDLLDLINHILDFSKLESGPIQLEKVSFDIETTIMEVLEIMLMKAKEQGLELRCEIDPQAPRNYLGDPIRVRQILLNLVSNAVKFTHRGKVEVRLSTELMQDRRHCLHFEVEDTGIGIPADRMQDLFKAFTQLDSSTTREYGGTGLGLSICQRLAEKMGGRVWGVSEPGVGSVFHVELMLESDEAGPAPVAELEGEPRLDRGFAEKHPLRILVTENDPRNTRLIREVLTHLGYAPHCVEDGDAAAECLTEMAFDVVLLDIHMGQRDGITVARQLRAGQFGLLNRDIYLITLTASVSIEDERQSRDAGVDAFLGKPFGLSDLLRYLVEADRVLEARRAAAPDTGPGGGGA